MHLSSLSYVFQSSTHPILLDLITWITFGEEYKSLSSLLCSFVHSPITPSFLRPNIIVNTLFLNTLSLRSTLYVSDHVSHPYNTTGKIMLILTFLGRKPNDKSFCTEWWHVFSDSNLLLISSWIQFLFVKIIPKYLKSSTSSKEMLSNFIRRFHPAFWIRFKTIYLAFTSSSSTKGSAFFLIVRTLPPNILTPSAQTRSWSVPFNSKPTWFNKPSERHTLKHS